MKILTCNIEGDLHLTEVSAMLKKERPDVFTFQEMLAKDVPFFEKEFGVRVIFCSFQSEWTVVTPGETTVHDHRDSMYGVAICTPHTVIESGSFEYADSDEELEKNFRAAGVKYTLVRSVLWARVQVGEQRFMIATTHFTWTPKGEVSEGQMRDMKTLISGLNAIQPCIFCGDLNTPRDAKVQGLLAQVMTDAIPPEITTSIDPLLHRTKNLQLLVDAMYYQSPYIIKNVRPISGVSDHIAFVGEATISSPRENLR